MNASDYIVNARAVSVWSEKRNRVTIKLDAITSVEFQEGPPTAYGSPAQVWRVIVIYVGGGEQFTFSNEDKAIDLEETLSTALLWGIEEESPASCNH